MESSLENTLKGNLLEQVSVEKVLKPKGFYKKIVLGFLTVASAVYVSYSCGVFIETGSVWGFAVAIFPFLVLSSIETIVVKSLVERLAVLALEALALVSFFYDSPKSYVMSAFGVFLFFAAWGEIVSRMEMKVSLEMNFMKVTAPVFKKTITGLILYVLILYVPHWNERNVFISPQAFGGVFVWTTGFVNNFYPEINFNSTVDDLAREIARYQLVGTKVYEELPPSVQKTVLDQISAQADDELKKILGGNITGSEKMGDVLYRIILDSLNRWRDQFGNWFVMAWISVVFLTARTIGAFVWWVSAFVSFMVYQLMLALNFITIAGESTTKETVIFP